MICPTCKRPMEVDAIFCEGCGTPTEEGLKIDKKESELKDVGELVDDSGVDNKESKKDSKKRIKKHKGEKQLSEPEKTFKPISLIESIVMAIILIIPVVNLVFLFVWSFKNNINKSKQNMSRAFLIVLFIVLIVAVIFGFKLIPVIQDLLNGYNNM